MASTLVTGTAEYASGERKGKEGNAKMKKEQKILDSIYSSNYSEYTSSAE